MTISDRVLPERVPSAGCGHDARRPHRDGVGHRSRRRCGLAAEDRSELLIVDTSGSMSGQKLRAAKQATVAAVDCLPDGVSFGIVSGNHEAALVYPSTGSWPCRRRRPVRRRRRPRLARGRGGDRHGDVDPLGHVGPRPRPGIRHAILLTDGKNESEEPADFDTALADARASSSATAAASERTGSSRSCAPWQRPFSEVVTWWRTPRISRRTSRAC